MSTTMTPSGQAPQIAGHWLLGNLPEYRRSPIDFAEKALRTGDLVRVRFGPLLVHFAFHPDSVKHILVDHHQNYGKQTRGFQKLSLMLGQGLLNSEGAFWKRQRRIAQPAFSRERVAAFGAIMVQEAEASQQRWQKPAAEGQPIDVLSEMMRLALRIAARTLLSTEMDHEVEQVEHALTEVLQQVLSRITSVFDLPLNIPTPKNRRFLAARGVLDRIVYGIIEQRRRGEGTHNDLLAMLMNARDPETGEAMTDLQLRDEVMTMFLAGHETTANALTWTWHLLGQHPEVREKLEAELASVLGGRAPQVQDLPRLSYNALIIKESLRLYPPAWLVARSVTAEDRINGCLLPAGSIVFVCPYATHRHPGFWDQPLRFWPERFAPGQDPNRPRHAYFPFGAGPRLCIGRDFALIEAELALATIAQRWRLEPVPGHPVVPHAMITLRPQFGLRMVPRPILG